MKLFPNIKAIKPALLLELELTHLSQVEAITDLTLKIADASELDLSLNKVNGCYKNLL